MIKRATIPMTAQKNGLVSQETVRLVCKLGRESLKDLDRFARNISDDSLSSIDQSTQEDSHGKNSDQMVRLFQGDSSKLLQQSSLGKNPKRWNKTSNLQELQEETNQNREEQPDDNQDLMSLSSPEKYYLAGGVKEKQTPIQLVENNYDLPVPQQDWTPSSLAQRQIKQKPQPQYQEIKFKQRKSMFVGNQVMTPQHNLKKNNHLQNNYFAMKEQEDKIAVSWTQLKFNRRASVQKQGLARKLDLMGANLYNQDSLVPALSIVEENKNHHQNQIKKAGVQAKYIKDNLHSPMPNSQKTQELQIKLREKEKSKNGIRLEPLALWDRDQQRMKAITEEQFKRQIKKFKIKIAK